MILLNGHFVGSFIPRVEFIKEILFFSYLFILCLNVLSCMLFKLEQANKIKDIQFACKGPIITQLMYVDGTIFFCEANSDACLAIKETLDSYGHLARQSISKQKSSIILWKQQKILLQQKIIC